MFIDIDYSKRLQSAKLHVAKPNKTIINPIPEKLNDNLSLKLGNINELNFSIPYLVENRDKTELVHNENVDIIKEKMLIRIKIGTFIDWYIVDEIEEDGDDSDVFNVTCFSIGYELKYKRISEYVEESINLTPLVERLLQKSVWVLGEVDPMFDAMFRSFDSGSDSNILENIFTVAETYGALIVWDTINRKISFKDATENGKFRGMTVNYGRLLQSIKKIRTTDEMVTRLYVEGSEGLSMQSLNPTGQRYLEDFSYFIYPFERDANKNTIKQSHFMSDGLCHALLDSEVLIAQKTPSIRVLTEDLLGKQSSLVIEKSTMTELELQLDTILGLLDIAKATEDTTLIATKTSEKNAKESEIQAQGLVVGGLVNDIAIINNSISDLQDEISKGSNFTKELLDELNLYIIESSWTDDRYIDVKELYNDAIKKFIKLKEPKVVIEASIDSLIDAIEEQYYWDKLVLGDLIKVKYPQMNIEYTAKIIEINYDLAGRTADLVIANTTDLLDDNAKLVQLLYENKSASSLVENNKNKWDKIVKVEEDVLSMITDEWDATKRKITAGVRNSVQIGNRGIIIENPDFPNEVIIMQSGVVALSKDSGETWKTAMTPDGIIAERIIGQLIAGQNLIITNSSGSFVMDENGVQIDAKSFIVRSSTGENKVDDWNKTGDFVKDFIDDTIITPYEKKRLKEEWTKIRLNHDFLSEILVGYYDDAGASLPEVQLFNQKYIILFDYLFVNPQADGFTLLDTSNLTKSTLVDREEFELSFDNYRVQVPVINRLIQMRAKDLAVSANDLAQQAQDNVNEVMNDVVYKLEILSSKGLLFRNGNISTVISAKVYRGKDDITNTIPNTGFIWKKYDKNGVLDTVWTNQNVGIGKTFIIDEGDVYQKAVFHCDVDIVE